MIDSFTKITNQKKVTIKRDGEEALSTLYAMLSFYEEDDLLHYQVDVQEYKRKEFEFSGSDIYFCSYLFSDFASSLNRADESSGTPRQGRFHYLIRTPEQDEYILEITRSADSLKGFDPEGFLQKCVTIE